MSQENKMIVGETYVEAPASTKTPPKVIANMPMDIYHSYGYINKKPNDYRLSKSMLSEIVDCPARFKHRYLTEAPQDEADHLNIGSAVHTLALEPQTFNDRYYTIKEGVKREKRTSAYQNEIANARGRSMLTHKDFINVQGMAKVLANDPLARGLLDGAGHIETTIFYDCPHTGLRKRVRPDWFRKDGKLVVNIKTTHSAKPDMFYKTAYDFAYDMGAAMELEAMNEVFGPDPERNYVMLIVEPDAPHIIGAFDVMRPMTFGNDEDNTPTSYAEVGAARVQKAMAQFMDCMKTGEWPGYTQGVEPMRVPGWMMKRVLDKGV